MKSKNELAFVVFMVHVLAFAWQRQPSDVYLLLKESGALSQYMMPCYDTLHTMGEKYLVKDITGYVRERGYNV